MLSTGSDLEMLYTSHGTKLLKLLEMCLTLALLKAQEKKLHQNENFDCLDLTMGTKLCPTIPDLFLLDELFVLSALVTSKPP